MKIRHSNLLLASALLLACGMQSLAAAELEAEVRAGVGVSDNIARTSTLEIEETITTVGFEFAATEQTRRLDLNIRSNVDYLNYVDDTFDAEWVGGLDGYANFSLIDERLSWDIRDNFGQQLLDPLEAARPGNRENVNFFTTGPTLTLSPGGRTPMVLDARYSRVGYEERPLVSIDYRTDPRSCIVDALSTMVVNNTQLKLYLWYDNEWGYANRTAELIQLVVEKGL